MNLSQATSERLIFLAQSFTSKEEIFAFVSKKLFQEGKVTSEEAFKEALYTREALGVTGFENGLAIPHGKSPVVKEATFAVILLKEPLAVGAYDSLDSTNKVDTLFVLAIPENQEGTTHLTLLAELATRLGEKDYLSKIKEAKRVSELLEILCEPREKESVLKKEKGLILGVTACAAGIAHTYMAAEAIVRKGKSLGYRVKVEKQGANGIEDRLTSDELIQASGVILAHDVAIKEGERFDRFPKVDTKVAEPIKNIAGVFQKLQMEMEHFVPSEQSVLERQEVVKDQTFLDEVKNAVLTGISYIIPVIIAGGMVGAIAVMLTQIFGLQAAMATPVSPETNHFWLFLLKALGGNMLSVLMPPILSAYMAYSLADKPGLAPGFAAGLAATAINSGFLGAMLGGLVAGFLMKWMKKNVRTDGIFKGFITFWVYPVVGTLITAVLMLFLIGQPVAFLNNTLLDFLKSMQGSNAIILGAIIGAMVSFDLGGPVNKAAYAFCIGAMASGNFVPYAIFASVKMVSAFSLSAAMFLKKDLWTLEEREIGMQTWILGFAGITEGAIPVAMGDPIRILGSFIGGSLLTGAIVAFANIGLNVPGAGIFSLALLQGQGNLLEAAVVWFGASLLGASVSTLLLIVTRQKKQSKQGIK